MAIVDCPYDSLVNNRKKTLMKLLCIYSLNDYDALIRAMGYFTFHYGKIDWVESDNEYWPAQDARLRQD